MYPRRTVIKALWTIPPLFIICCFVRPRGRCLVWRTGGWITCGISCRLGVAKARMCNALFSVKRRWHISSPKGYQRWRTSTTHTWEKFRSHTGHPHDKNGSQRWRLSTSRCRHLFGADFSLSVKNCDLRPTRIQRYVGNCMRRDTSTFRAPQDKLDKLQDIRPRTNAPTGRVHRNWTKSGGKAP